MVSGELDLDRPPNGDDGCEGLGREAGGAEDETTRTSTPEARNLEHRANRHPGPTVRIHFDQAVRAF
jgi:hypothetical protein